MPPYVYGEYRNPYVLPISDLIQREGDIAAAGARQLGDIYARQAENNGNIWGRAIQGVGQTIGAIPQQIQQAQQQQQLAQARALEIQRQQVQNADMLQRQQGGKAVDAMLAGNQLQPDDTGPRMPSSYVDERGLFDIPKITAELNKGGYGHLTPELIKSAENINASIQQHKADQQKAAQSETLVIGDIAHGALQMNKAGTPLDRAIDFAAQPALLNGNVTQQDFDKVKAMLAPLPLEQQIAALANMRDRAALIAPTKNLGKDAQELDRYGRVVASNIVPDKPTEASLAAAAAGRDQTAAKALDLLNVAKHQPAHLELKPGRITPNGPIVAASFNPETQKITYNGEDVTTRWQPPRDPMEAQAAAIAAQVAQQARSQKFAEMQAGKKEFDDKYGLQYQDSLEKINTLRNFIAEAENGNKVAGAMTPLLATLGVVTSEGVKRINQTEVNSVQGAGSLLDRIKGRIGKITTGQPMPQDLLDDLKKLSNVLQSGARERYEGGFRQIQKTYPSVPDTVLLPVDAPLPVGPQTPPALTPGNQALANRPGGR